MSEDEYVIAFERQYVEVRTQHSTKYYPVANDDDYEYLIKRQTYPDGLLFQKHSFPIEDVGYPCPYCGFRERHAIHDIA